MARDLLLKLSEDENPRMLTVIAVVFDLKNSQHRRWYIARRENETSFKLISHGFDEPDEPGRLILQARKIVQTLSSNKPGTGPPEK